MRRVCMNSHPSQPSEERWLTEKELAFRLHISPRHLINLRAAGLPYIQLGVSVRYDFDEVMKYLKTNRRLSSHIERRKRHGSPEPR
jgi:hypothetical protein